MLHKVGVKFLVRKERGSNAVLGNPWMEDWLLKRGATNLMPQKPPSLAEGAGEVFKNLGLKRKPKGMFTQEEQFGDDSGFTNQNSNSKRGGMAEGPYGYGSEDDKELTIDGKPLSAYSWSGLKSSATSPINTAKTGGMFGNLVGGLLGNAIGSGFGAYSGSHAVDDAIAQSTGYNPDVSAWSQFFNSVTGGLFGQSGSEQQQAELDAFSGMDNMFEEEDYEWGSNIGDIRGMIADAKEAQRSEERDFAERDAEEEAFGRGLDFSQNYALHDYERTSDLSTEDLAEIDAAIEASKQEPVDMALSDYDETGGGDGGGDNQGMGDQSPDSSGQGGYGWT